MIGHEVLFARPTILGTPEQNLWVAVLSQAWLDLSSSDKHVRYEAHEFWFSTRRVIVEHRRAILAIIGIDDDYLQDKIERYKDPNIEPPRESARVRNERLAEHVLERWPDKPATLYELANITGAHPFDMRSRFAMLERHGKIVRVSRGLYVPADKLHLIIEPEDLV